jgi:carboxysome shell carbonic anhydrase
MSAGARSVVGRISTAGAKSGHPLAEPSLNAALAARAHEIDRAFAAIEPVLVGLVPRQFEPGFPERAAAEIANGLGIELDPERLRARWNAPLDMPALHARLVLRTFARLVERNATRPPALEDGEPIDLLIRRFGFHAVDVTTCADGRLGGLLDHVLRVPPAIVVSRDSFAGAMFDVEEAIARFERVELGRWRDGSPNPGSEPTRYLKIGVYHFSSVGPSHEGCAAHGSDERRAASALLRLLEDFAEGTARRHGERSRPAILLVGVDTDTDAIRVHVPDTAGRIDLDRFLSSAELHAATRALPRAEAKEEIRRRVAGAIGVAADDPASEGMRWFCGYLLKNNIAQVDAVLARFGGPYPDRGHEERLIVVGDPIDDVQLRNLAFQAQMRSIEEGAGDLAVGVRLLGERLGPAGFAVPVLVVQTFDRVLPGAAERAAGRASVMLQALQRRYADRTGRAPILAEAAIRPTDGGPLRFLPSEAASSAGRCTRSGETVG